MPPDLDIPSSDGLYPIRHVCAETGINPVTLRAWERRYGLLQPVRTPKGHRLYSAADIDKILRILTLIEEGVAVSQIGRLFEPTTDYPLPAVPLDCSTNRTQGVREPQDSESDVAGHPGTPCNPDTCPHRSDRNHPELNHSDLHHSDPHHSDPHHSDPHHSDLHHSDLHHSELHHSDQHHSDLNHLDTHHSDVAHQGDLNTRAGLPPLVRDPISEALIAATAEFSVGHLERTYARLLMRHGWEGVHDLAFIRAYHYLRSEAQHDPSAEARLAVFAAWATASFSDQLRSALLLCEGPTCPCITLGHGHRRLEGLLFQLACARQGLRVMPLLDAPSLLGLAQVTAALQAPAVAFYLPALNSPPLETARLQHLLAKAPMRFYLAGPGAPEWARLNTQGDTQSNGLSNNLGNALGTLVTLPERPLPAADQLSRTLLGTAHGADPGAGKEE